MSTDHKKIIEETLDAPNQLHLERERKAYVKEMVKHDELGIKKLILENILDAAHKGGAFVNVSDDIYNYFLRHVKEMMPFIRGGEEYATFLQDCIRPVIQNEEVTIRYLPDEGSLILNGNKFAIE